jgi:signal peptidase I
MWPLIAEGDRVLVERARGEGIGFGEIAVFSRAGQWIIHRVLARRRVSGREYFVEKGDNNFGAGLVPLSDVLGRVRAIEISGGIVPLSSRPARLLQYVLALYSYVIWRWWAAGERLLPHGIRERVQGRWSRRLCRLPPRVLLRLLGTR